MSDASKSPVPVKDPIVWIDCEMTGLDPVADALVEIAVIVTDSQLTPLHTGMDLVIKPPTQALENMAEVVVQMHTESGLLDLLDQGTTVQQAQAQVLEYVRSFVPEAGKAPLAGNSVGTDKMFLDRDMPELTGHLHYRIIDVSSIKELARRWYPRAYFNAPAKDGGHRALADIAESIDELRYYRQILFPDDPGPTSQDAKAVAQRIAESSTLKALANAGAPEAQEAADDTGPAAGEPGPPPAH